MSRCNVIYTTWRALKYTICGFVERVWRSKDHPPSLWIQANICVELQQLPPPPSLLLVYSRHSSDINEQTHYTHINKNINMTTSALFGSGEVMLAVFHGECVLVSLCEPYRPDSSRRGDGTVASGEMDVPGDQCKGCEWEGGKGRRGGGRGLSRHAAPLGRWAMTSKALPPSEGKCC